MDLLLLGAGLGFAAGVSPGPLLTLVVASTVERGFGAGLRVALAPVLTDAPIVLLAVFVLRGLPEGLVRGVTLFGGLFVVYLGIETLRRAGRQRPAEADATGTAADIWRGMVVNVLNPHPWLFWVSVGAPLVLDAARRGWLPVAAFLVSFYLLIVGSKIALAGLVARGRHRLSGPWYGRVLLGAGLLLVALGALLVAEAWTSGLGA